MATVASRRLLINFLSNDTKKLTGASGVAHVGYAAFNDETNGAVYMYVHHPTIT